MDESQQNRTSDAAATRKRRSSILKSHRPPRAPFSELEFNVATPTDTAKSRRVSFSRRTGVAEFVTNEATTTWKNFYEEHNKTAESSGNDSEMNPPRATVGHLGRGSFEQHFQEVEAVDLISTSWTRGQVETSINNINFDQQIASLECFEDQKLTTPHQNFEMSSLSNYQSKIFGEDLIVSGMREITDRISVNFSVVQPMGMSKNDELDAIQRDIRNAQSQGLPGNVIGPGPGPFADNFSEYIEIDLNTTHAAIKHEESDMSITDTIHNSKVEDVSKSNPSFVVENKILDKDWVADKENILINPYIAPKETSNFAINEECDKILVFDGKRLTIQCEKESEPTNHVPTHTSEGKLQRKTFVLNSNDDLPNVIDDPCPSMLQGTSRYFINGKNDSQNDMSITQALNGDLEINSNKRKTIVYESFNGDISVTQAIPSNIILDDKTMSPRSKTLSGSQSNNVSLQPLPKTILPESQSRPSRRNTILYEDDTAQISLTQALPLNLLLAKESEKEEFSGKRRTIVFESDSADISITQALPSNLVLTDKSSTATGKRKTIVFEDEAGNISLTQAVPANLIFSKKGNISPKERTIVYENDVGDISLTQIVPSDLILPQKCTSMPDKRKTVIYDDNDGNISITQAVPSNVMLSHKDSDKMRTVVFESENSNISITQPVGSNVVPNIKNDENCKIKSQINILSHKDSDKMRTVVFESENSNISITQPVGSNLIPNIKKYENCKIESQIKAESVISEQEISKHDKSKTEHQEINALKEIIDTENVDTKTIKADETQSVSFDFESKNPCSDNKIELPDKAASIISEKEIGELDKTLENVKKKITVKDEIETESMETTKINDDKARNVLIDSDSKNTFSTQSSTLIKEPSSIESDSTLANGNVINHTTHNKSHSQCSTSTSFSNKLKENVHEINVSMSEAGDVCEQKDRPTNVARSPYEKEVDVSMAEAGEVYEQKDRPTNMPHSPYEKEVDVSMSEAGDVFEQKDRPTNVFNSLYEKEIDVSMSEANDVCEQKDRTTTRPCSPYEKELDVSMSEAGNVCEQKGGPTTMPHGAYKKQLDVSMSEASDICEQKCRLTTMPHGAYKKEFDVSMPEASDICEQKCRPTNVPPSPYEKSLKALIKIDNEDVQFQVEKDKSVDGVSPMEKDKCVDCSASKESLFYITRDSPIPEPVSPNRITKHTKTANDTDDLVNLISELTDREEEKHLITEVQSFTEITAREDTLAIEDISNVAEGHISLLPKRRSIVLSREDLMNNISMAQAVLQKSRAEIEVSEVMDDTMTTSIASKDQIDRATTSKKMVRVSNEVVKKLYFEEDLTFNEDSCGTFEFQRGVSPVKKTAFGEESYTRDNKANVIPTYLKDVTDGIKQLKSDLVKTTADTLPFETLRVDKGVRKVPKTASLQVQANHKASSQVDLTESESAPKIRRSSFSGDKEKSVKKIIQCIPEKMYEPKSESVTSPLLPIPTLPVARSQEADRVILFDHNSPMSNILLAPMDLSEVQSYNPVRSEEAVNETSEQATPEPTENKKCDKDICIQRMTTERECSAVNDVKTTSVTMQCDAQESDSKSENKSVPESVSVNKSFCSDYNSGSSNSKPQSLNQSIGAMAVEMKDTEVNTTIIIRSTEGLLQNISSLTIMDDTVSRSRHLVTTGNARLIYKTDEREDECLQNTESKDTFPDRAIKFSPDRLKQLDKSKGHKRVHSPRHEMNHKNCTLESLEVTPKPACKIQKINYISPIGLSDRESRAPDYDSTSSQSESGKETRSGICSPHSRRSPSSQKRSPEKFKLCPKEQEVKVPVVSVQRFKTEYNTDGELVNVEVSKIDISKNLVAECESGMNVVAKIDSSKNLVAECESGMNVVAKINSSKNLVAECESGMNVVAKIDSSKNLVAECESGMNVVAKIDSSKNLVAECESGMNVVAKIDSSKNLVAECESGMIVVAKIDSSKNLVAECESGMNVVAKIDSSKNLVAECESGVNVVAKIDSSKNLVGECESGMNVVGKIDSSKNLVAEFESGMNVVGEINSSKNLVAECESGMNVVAKIDSSKKLAAKCESVVNVVAKTYSSKNLVADCKSGMSVVAKIDSSKELAAKCESDVKVVPKIDSSKNLVADCESGMNVVAKIDSSKELAAKCESVVNVVAKIDSSKNLVADCESGVTVGTKIDSSKNIVAECESGVNVVTKIDSSKNLVAEYESDVNVVAKIDKLSFMGSHDCAWKSASNDTWVFKLLRGRLHLSVRLAHRGDNLVRTFVRPDTRVLHVQLELDRSHENKNPVAVVCARFAEEAMRPAVRRGAACAGEVPALLCACASVARVALQWSSVMDNAYWHLAFSLSEDGRLELNVANVPLRSVWKVSMRVALAREAGRDKPCPLACDVDVTAVVSDYPVSPQETARALHGLPRDWGHAPRTVWRIFKYLKHLKSKSSNEDLLLFSKR